jgi:hypothetical protein
VRDDGDRSGTAGDNPCSGPQTQNCDDNCPFVANPDQLADASRIGRACRCGDVDADGQLTTNDFSMCVFDPSQARCRDFCDVNGDASCDVRDTLSLRMALYGQCIPNCALYPEPLPGVNMPTAWGRSCRP